MGPARSPCARSSASAAPSSRWPASRCTRPTCCSARRSRAPCAPPATRWCAAADAEVAVVDLHRGRGPRPARRACPAVGYYLAHRPGHAPARRGGGLRPGRAALAHEPRGRAAGRGAARSLRLAVVTGASSGIGDATAELLAREGWRVVLVARRADRLRRSPPSSAERGRGAGRPDRRRRARRACARPSSARAAGSGCSSTTRAPSGARRSARAATTTCAGRWTSTSTRVVRLTEALLPLLRAAAPSSIVNVSSVAGRVGRPRTAPTRRRSSRWPAGARRSASRSGRTASTSGWCCPGSSRPRASRTTRLRDSARDAAGSCRRRSRWPRRSSPPGPAAGTRSTCRASTAVVPKAAPPGAGLSCAARCGACAHLGRERPSTSGAPLQDPEAGVEARPALERAAVEARSAARARGRPRRAARAPGPRRRPRP